MASRTAVAAVLAAALMGASAATHDETVAARDGSISVAHAAALASSPAAETQIVRAHESLSRVFVAVPLAALEPANARPLPAAVAPDAQPLRPDVVTCPSQGPPRAG